VAGFICILASFGTIVFECLTAVMLSRRWSSTVTDLRLPHTRLAFNVRLIKRLVVFSIFALLVYLSAIFQVNHPLMQYVFFFTSALLPLGVFLVFGTQASILRIWAIWIPRKPRTETEPDAFRGDKFTPSGNALPTTIDWKNGWKTKLTKFEDANIQV